MTQDNFTRREVKTAFRSFSDLAGDVEGSDWESWPENLRQFLHFCNTNPVMCAVFSPLKSSSLGYYQEWEEQVLHQKQRNDGLFPTGEDEKAALFYQILSAVNEDTKAHNFIVNFLYRLHGCHTLHNASQAVQAFNDEIFSKFTRTVGYRLEDIQENIADEAEVSRGALIAFHLTNNGTFVLGDISAVNSNMGIGESQVTV